MRRPLAGAFAAAAALLPGTVALAAPTPAPVDAYPVRAERPVGASKLPFFLDDDETVQVKVAPDGSNDVLMDIVLLRLRGSGDYVIVMPGTATAVRAIGGDSPPVLQDGHVNFMGSVFGPGQLGAQVTIDRSAQKLLPLSLRISYTASGKAVSPRDLAATHGPITVEVEVTNHTPVPRQFVSGSADAAPLAAVLDDLRQAPTTYTPETDMQAALPLPASLPVAAPAVTVTQPVLVPFSLVVTAKLPSEDTVSDPGDGAAVTDARGTSLTWRNFSPRAPGGAGVERYTFTFSGTHPRVPAIEVRADPLPMPAALFTAPGRASWSAYLAGRQDRTAETLLAQAGMAAFHRLGELALPLGRPGPGPAKVKYDFILDSGAAVPNSAPPPPPARAQPWAVVLAFTLLAGGGLGAYRLWARH